MKPTIEWTPEDSTQAIKQGWEIFWCDNENHMFQLQAVETENIFSNDKDAWLFVKEAAKNNDPLASKALQFLEEKANDEYKAIMSI